MQHPGLLCKLWGPPLLWPALLLTSPSALRPSLAGPSVKRWLPAWVLPWSCFRPATRWGATRSSSCVRLVSAHRLLPRSSPRVGLLLRDCLLFCLQVVFKCSLQSSSLLPVGGGSHEVTRGGRGWYSSVVRVVCRLIFIIGACGH